MSLRMCPPPPTAVSSTMNPSWSPALQPEQNNETIPDMLLQSYISYRGRLFREEEVISPQLLLTIQRPIYLIRTPSATWWARVEDEEQRTAQPGDNFLCRRDDVIYDVMVTDPTEEERPTLEYKKRFLSQTMAYYRHVNITVDYGSTYEGNGRWIRYKVAYLRDEESPYPFKKDCRDDMHK
jgi:hypothetical protein